MGNGTDVCRATCIQQQEIIVKQGEEIATITKAEKLQPIIFQSDDRTPELASVIEKEKIDIQIEETPKKPKLQSTPNEPPAHENKLTSAKKMQLHLQEMVVVSPQSCVSNHIKDDLIEVPYSVIRLTITSRLRRTIDHFGGEIFSKYEKQQHQSMKWKLHRKGYYLTKLGQGLYGVLTNNFYYQGELEETKANILPIGEGILISENGIYVGSFKGGKANGKGQFRDVDLKAVYKGTWKDGVLQEGIIESEQFKFQGKFQQGLAHGSGKLIFKETSFVYNGHFQDGLFHDKNGFLQSKNYIYEGGFQSGRKEGQGCLVQKQQKYRDNKSKYHPAEQYEGMWHRDCFQGRRGIAESRMQANKQ